MNRVKKIIAFAVIVFITFRFIIIGASASFAAPVMVTEEVTTLLEAALVGSGLYAETELEGKSYLELNDLLKDGINSGQINPKTNYYTDPVSGIQFNLIDLFSKPEVQATFGVTNSLITNTVDNAVRDFFSDYEKLSDSVNLTYVNSILDPSGYGAVYVQYDSSGNIQYRVYCEYIDITTWNNGNDHSYVLQHILRQEYYTNGKLVRVNENPVDTWYTQNFNVKELSTVNGDVRLEDGTQLEIDAEMIPVIGEVDGVQITPDMLNPDGTVTIDGTTYYPKDFIDWDKFKDPAIIDLLNQILAKIDTAPIAEPDTTKDLVDSITESVSVSVPDELSDYIMPSGIISVFPFCLPVDLYRGFKLLNATPVAPVLKIPFEIPEFGYFKGYKTVLTIEFEKYDKYFSVFRWGTYFLFVISLIFISTKIVKGAGA